MSETVNIETSKDYVKFSVTGESGSGNILLKPNDSGKDDRIELEVE
jgi:ribosomal protein S5